MQINISVRHGHLSEATQSKIRGKAEKLLRYFERLAAIEFTIDLEHEDNPSVELQVAAEHKHDFVARDQSSELMASVDQVVHKMEQQLKKYKEKIQNRRAPGLGQQAVSAAGEAEDYDDLDDE